MDIMEEGQNQIKFTTKRIKEKIMDERRKDRISVLSDGLLVEILSRLPATKYAIRTGTLSKAMETSLDFRSFSDFQRHNHPWSNFVSFVCKTLSQCRQPELKKFLLSTRYDTRSKSQINSLIRYALSCNVEDLNIKIWNAELRADKFLLDQVFFLKSCFTDLRLSGFILNPIGAINWKNLRNLWISEANLDEELIENILSGSPLLETLSLDYCYGYKQLNITSKSVKNLVFHGYYWVPPDDKYDDFTHIIEISARNILSLTIKEDLLLWKLLLADVSSLIEANLDYTMRGHYETTEDTSLWHHETTLEEEEGMLKGFILNLSHVKKLKTGMSCSKVMSRLKAKGFHFPSSIKFPDDDDDELEIGDSSDSE